MEWWDGMLGGEKLEWEGRTVFDIRRSSAKLATASGSMCGGWILPSLGALLARRACGAKFWKELHNIIGTKLNLATTHHAVTDGGSERYIQTITGMMRAFALENPESWDNYVRTMSRVSAVGGGAARGIVWVGCGVARRACLM